MTTRAAVFDTIMVDYLNKVAGLSDPERVSTALGIAGASDGYRIPYYDREYIVSTNTIVDQAQQTPSHATSVILCQYLLLCPDAASTDDSLVTYKDFRDAGPYVGGFKNTTELPIVKRFSGKTASLERHCQALGGRSFDTGVSCQLAYRFQALPRVPIFLLFHDADDEFPAQCTLLFQKNAASYLDMECLAMLGSTLSTWLVGK
jgi:hypothetical protein